ncbi:Zinc finger protein VAR3, chloroplastic [Linum grandiflorum]
MYQLLCSGRVSVYLRTHKLGGNWCFSWLRPFSSETEAFDSSIFRNQIDQPSLSSQTEVSKENGQAFQISHPWPEWMDLMELLVRRGYYEADGHPFQNEKLGPKDTNSIRTACLNFARDQFGLIRFFSREDIQIISKFGCPTLDRKVINSAKRLRAHVGVDEGNVCSSCNLRGDCDRAYVKAREDEGGRTVDVMRILMTHGLDFVSGAVVNKPCQSKLVKESIRKLLKEMAEYGSQQLDSDGSHNARRSSNSEKKGFPKVAMKQGDWHCPNCEFLNFARNIKCLRCNVYSEERLKRLREDRDHLPLKKGDWVCVRCNFLNFAKNTRCLQCEERPPKRRMNPGEWECESCNYLNFRRNMVCLKCDHRRAKVPNASSTPSKLEHCNVVANGEEGTSSRSVNKDDDSNPKLRANSWRFVEEGRDADDGSGFMNFPIAGGKSNLSQDPTAWEEWKLQMLERSKVGSSEEYGNDDRERGPGWLNIGDDDEEEVATWFGNGNKSLD